VETSRGAWEMPRRREQGIIQMDIYNKKKHDARETAFYSLIKGSSGGLL
jgi:hypothetical protein